MKVLNDVKAQIVKYGYKKSGNSFWKIENGFYKLINFQAGAHGKYFFINVALHPNGLPMLYATKRLVLTERPKESECVLRQRIEQISNKTNSFRGDIGFVEDVETIQALLKVAMPDIELWLNKWGTYETILSSDFDEISKLFSAVPLIWKKQFLMLKCYCAFSVGNYVMANEYFSAYKNENSNMDFSLVDDYMYNLIASSLSTK